MSIFASFLRGAYKLSGAKKAFALPEDQTPSVQIVLPMAACCERSAGKHRLL